jgi:hypothetical protein
MKIGERGTGSFCWICSLVLDILQLLGYYNNMSDANTGEKDQLH